MSKIDQPIFGIHNFKIIQSHIFNENKKKVIRYKVNFFDKLMKRELRIRIRNRKSRVAKNESEAECGFWQRSKKGKPCLVSESVLRQNRY